LFAMSALPNCPIRNDNIEYVIDVYHLVLRDFDGEELKAAAAQYLSTGIYFPTPGQLRQAALELDLAARGIPTAAEAWADVLGAVRHVEAYNCPVGGGLRTLAIKAQEAHDGAGYLLALNQYIDHCDRCGACRGERTEEVYCHPVVERTVRRLGGRAALFTDNLAADRARFIEAYGAILESERKEAGRMPEVADWVEQQRGRLKTDARPEIKRLAEKLAK
jgi:hypothetical protein